MSETLAQIDRYFDLLFAYGPFWVYLVIFLACFIENLFPDNPLGFTVIGKRDNISNFHRADTISYVKGKYSANRLVIAASGNVEHEALVRLVETSLNTLQPAEQNGYQKPARSSKPDSVIENGAIQAHICIGTQSYRYRESRKFALLVLNTLLSELLKRKY